MSRSRRDHRLWRRGRVANIVPLTRAGTGADTALVERLSQGFLRRFDIEHTFRMIKQTLGWTRPKLRDPEAADRWTWLIVACYTQLRRARPLVEDLHRPWEKPARPDRQTPARVRRGFRNLRRRPDRRPLRRNRAGRALDDRPDQETAAQPSATT